MAKKKEEKGSREIVPFRPLREFMPFREMEKFFEDFMGKRWGHWPVFRWPEFKPEEMAPSVDVYEEGDNVVLKAELPGMKREDLEVNITDNTITISGEKKKEEKVERKDYLRMERSYGSFVRSFSLPSEVESEKANATFKDGILEIKVPKTEEAKKKKIKVSVQ
jgi:HSP20 family protein